MIKMLPFFVFLLIFSYLEIEKHEFLLGGVIDAVVSQVMGELQDRGLQLIRDIPEEVNTLTVYGDQPRIQQVLINFLLNMVRHSPLPGGWVEVQVRPTLKPTSDGKNAVRVALRYAFYLIALTIKIQL